MRWRRLFTEPLYLAVAPGHPLAGRESVRLGEAAGEGFVLLRRGWPLREQVEQLCEAAGFEVEPAFEVDDLPTVRGLVAAGLGVAVTPALGDDAAGGARVGVRLVPLDDDGATREVGVAWSAERRLLPSAELFRRYLLREATRSARSSARFHSGT